MNLHETPALLDFDPCLGLPHPWRERRAHGARRADDLRSAYPGRSPHRDGLAQACGEAGAEDRADLAARLLGPVVLKVRGEPVLDWPACRAKSLLKYLLLHRHRPVPRQTLLDAFWPEAGSEAARNSLHVAVHRLRRLLLAQGLDRDPVLCMDGHVQLHPQLTVWLDTEGFEARLDAAQTLPPHAAEAALVDALALVRGELVAADRTEGWIEDFRHRYNDRTLHALHTLALARLSAGDVHGSLVHAQRMLAVDTCSEEAHRVLMRGHGQLAQPARVERQYRACVQALRSRLGVAPQAATTSLYRALLDDAPSQSTQDRPQDRPQGPAREATRAPARESAGAGFSVAR